jgi:hypothetical protein
MYFGYNNIFIFLFCYCDISLCVPSHVFVDDIFQDSLISPTNTQGTWKLVLQ